MRALWVGLCVVGAVCVGGGCRPGPGTESRVASYHFAGMSRIALSKEAATAKDIVALSASRALWDQTVERLARSPERFLGGGVGTNVAAVAPWLRSMLDDLGREESFLEVTGREGRSWSWTLGVALKADRAAVWDTNLVALVKAWGLGDVIRGTSDGLPAAEVALAGGRRLRWVLGPGWVLVGAAEPPMPGMGQALQALKASGRPVPALGAGWLAAAADLRQLAPLWGWATGHPWPRIEVSVGPRQEDVRVTGRVIFPEGVTGPLSAWHVPTNIIADPLVSFGAGRGFGPLLARASFWRELQLDPVPGEFYLWSQGAAEFQSFLAVPLPDATNQLRRAAGLAAGLFTESARADGLAQFVWNETNSVLSWRGLPPLVTPMVRAARDGGTEYLVGALFPGVRRGPLPAEMLSQLNRSNLVYYHWEITQSRLLQSRLLSQLASVIAGTPQLSTNQAGLKWLLEIEPKLGNTVTEITATSPREWGITRKSHLGLTAVELVALVRWLESAGFPAPGVMLPETAGVARRPRPASQPVRP